METAKKLSGISALLNVADVDEKQRKELKKKIRDAQLDNLFAAMASYCKK